LIRSLVRSIIAEFYWRAANVRARCQLCCYGNLAYIDNVIVY